MKISEYHISQIALHLENHRNGISIYNMYNNGLFSISLYKYDFTICKIMTDNFELRQEISAIFVIYVTYAYCLSKRVVLKSIEFHALSFKDITYVLLEDIKKKKYKIYSLVLLSPIAMKNCPCKRLWFLVFK